MKEMKDKCPRRWNGDKKSERALKEYLDPYSSNIGLNLDSKHGEKRLMFSQMRKIKLQHNQMNNNKMSTD